MLRVKNLLAATAMLLVLNGCSSKAADQAKYPQLHKEAPQKVMIVVHGDDSVPAELVAAFSKKVPEVVADHGFEIVDAQQRQVTEVPALTDVDAVLYVDIKRWTKDYSAVIAAESVLELEFKMVSATSDQELWSHKETHNRTHLYLGGDLVTELLHRVFFEASTAYENRANAVTKKVFSDFPEVVAANR